MLTNHQRSRLPRQDDDIKTQPIPMCAGPCDQGRTPCPCPSACGLSEELDPLTLGTLWSDTPPAVRAVLIVVMACLLAALSLHLAMR